ncbi:hypothetical protein ASO20_00785 [Mycoplasma sp. (ex Biomphalaria glabrata)]|uniref:YitT family protein n=1 Tax=Mycoplasma sp. (ex Biomphalaria glabrata) TaxID=1749074 RepID=UPI00073AB0B2|nr:YitT family protein [Mycoplasma sp. (ex Biomphalaria glabrata)]ALV23212.1 hypothetical protein ASO20_00785 [Mycoplasma sp. (ex Biomphalaria glabrata)]
MNKRNEVSAVNKSSKKRKFNVRNNPFLFYLNRPRLNGYFNVYRVIGMLVASILFFISYRFFLQNIIFPRNPIAGGVTGISFVIGQFFRDPNTNALVVYASAMIINIPFLIFAWIKLGKRFTFYTSIYLVIQLIIQIIFSLNPSFNDIFDKAQIFEISSSNSDSLNLLFYMGYAIISGIIFGIGQVIVYNVGASSAGFDIISYYLSLNRGKPIGRMNITCNSFVIVGGLIVTAIQNPNFLNIVDKLILTILYQLVTYGVVDRYFPKQKKIYVQIFTNKIDVVERVIQESNTRFTYTKLEAIGGHSREKQSILIMVMTLYESSILVPNIQEHLPDCFITISKMENVYGHFTPYTLD